MHRSLAFCALGVLLADLLSKYWIANNIPLMGMAFPEYPYGGIPVFRDFFGVEFSIVHVTNRGAAWGFFGEYQFPLLLMRIVMIAAMGVYLIFFNRSRRNLIPLSLIVTGAIGNVADYFIYGHVVDMLHFVLWGYDFPVFNVADSFVTIGIVWMMGLSFLELDEQEVPA